MNMTGWDYEGGTNFDDVLDDDVSSGSQVTQLSVAALDVPAELAPGPTALVESTLFVPEGPNHAASRQMESLSGDAMDATKTITRESSRSASELSSSSQFTFNVEELVNESPPSNETGGDHALASSDSQRSFVSFPPHSFMQVVDRDNSLERSDRSLMSQDSDMQSQQRSSHGITPALSAPSTYKLHRTDAQNVAFSAEKRNVPPDDQGSIEGSIRNVPSSWPVQAQGIDTVAFHSQHQISQEPSSQQSAIGIDESHVYTTVPPTLNIPPARPVELCTSQGQTLPITVAYEKPQTQTSQVTQGRRKSLVTYGRPRDDVVEGWQVYSRHSLFMWGAHKSDVCPVNGNPRDGCDSVICMKDEDEELGTIDDLDIVQITCSIRNGGGALFANYQMSRLPNAPHSYPIRVFRKSRDTSGVEGLRYDGLYHVATIRDETGQRLTVPSRASSRCTFLLKRNIAGQLRDQNLYTLEELWELVKPGNVSSLEPLELEGGHNSWRYP